MAAGLSRERETVVRRRILHGLVRDLQRAGVPAVYHKATKATHAEVWSAPGLDSPDHLRIWLQTLRASNGESYIVSHLVFNGEHFGDFERGLQYVKGHIWNVPKVGQ